MTISNRTIARMYTQGSLHSDWGGGGVTSKTINSLGRGIAIRNLSLPHAAEYDAFVDLQLAKTRGRQTKMTGNKLRRAAIMRRDGKGLKECGDAIGVTASCIKDWLDRLPVSLGGESTKGLVP